MKKSAHRAFLAAILTGVIAAFFGAACGEANPLSPSGPDASPPGTDVDGGMEVRGAPSGLTASTDQNNYVRLAWASPTGNVGGLSGYVVLRDGVELARTGSETRYDDATATPATLAAPTGLSASDGTRLTGVMLAWQATGAGGAAASYAYTVQALYGTEASAPSGPATGSRSGSMVTGYELSRDDGATWQPATTALSYDDTDAPRAPVTFVAPNVTSDTPRSWVRLELPTYPTVGAMPSATYRVRAKAGAAAGMPSAATIGKRGGGRAEDVVIQWQRSPDAADGMYADIPGVTGRLSADGSAPITQPRFFRARAVALWAEGMSSGGAAQRFMLKSVSAGSFHTCGVRSDDKVVCWGDNGNGQAPTTPSTDTFKSVSAGSFHTCGVRSDDKVVCWGDNSSGQATPSTDTFKNVSAGGSHTCGVRSDDKVVCWGQNSSGQAPVL